MRDPADVQQQAFAAEVGQQLFAREDVPATDRSRWLLRQTQSRRGSPARNTATAVRNT